MELLFFPQMVISQVQHPFMNKNLYMWLNHTNRHFCRSNTVYSVVMRQREQKKDKEGWVGRVERERQR